MSEERREQRPAPVQQGRGPMGGGGAWGAMGRPVEKAKRL